MRACPAKRPVLDRAARVASSTWWSTGNDLSKHATQRIAGIRGFRCRRQYNRGIIIRTTTEVDAHVEEEKAKECFDWFKHWWPVQFVYNLDDDRPNRIELLGEFFAVWKGKNGEWVAMKDMCPHRLAPLSEGRVEDDGTLMCSYHGWRFNECGKCVKIPQADDERSHKAACNNPRSAATTFPCKDRGGIVWIWPDAAEDAFEQSGATPVAMLDEHAEYFEKQIKKGLRLGYVRDLPYGQNTLIENILDPSHVPFSHHGTSPFTTRSQGRPIPFRNLESSNPSKVIKAERPLSMSDGYAVHQLLDQCQVSVKTVLTGSQNSPAFFLLWTSPIADGTSRILMMDVPPGATSGNPPKWKLTTFLGERFPVLVHMRGNIFLDGDAIFLHILEGYLRDKKKGGWNSQRYYTPMKADSLVMQYRRWISKEAGGGPFGHVRQEERDPLPRRTLLDRYNQHTRLSKESQKSLALINRMAGVCDFLSRGSLLITGAWLVRSMHIGILYKWPTIAGLVVSALFFAIGRYLREKIVPLFYFVDYVHADKN